jgi:flagellar hook-associated protein 3 FlgL
MPILSLGDGAQNYYLSRHTVSIKNDLNARLIEVSSGRTAGMGAHLKGDYGQINGIERSIALISAFKISSNRANLIASGQQSALDGVGGILTDNGAGLITAGTTGLPTTVDTMAAKAASDFTMVIDRLNARAGDLGLFSGAATMGNAVASAEAILSELTGAIAGETTADGIVAAVDAWFDTPGGGYEMEGYLGSPDAMAAIAVREGEDVELGVTAFDPSIRETLKGFALAALAARGVVSGSEKAALIRVAGEVMVDATRQVTTTRAAIGTVQARIDDATTRNGASLTSLKLAREAVIGVEPYEAAIRLEDVQAQLEKIYILTARLSELSLAKVL